MAMIANVVAVEVVNGEQGTTRRVNARVNDVKVVSFVALLDDLLPSLGFDLKHGIENVRELVLLEVLEQNVANHHRSEVLHRHCVLRDHLLLVRLGLVDVLQVRA